MEEIFIPIRGFEDVYEISNYGRIKSLYPRNNKNFNPKILTIKTRQVCLHSRKLGIKKSYIVSHLVWTHFKGEIPNGYIIDHIIEGDVTNNHIDNLQLLTRQQNSTKAAKLGQYKVGGKHHKTNITDEIALEVIKMKKSGVKRRIILEKFNITPDQFYNITGKKFWLHLKP